jgi:hypothetical protein
MSLKLTELCPRSRIVVVLKTSTVTLVLFQLPAARVNVSSIDDIVVAVPVRTVPVWVTSGTSIEVALTTPPPACVPRTVTWSPTRTLLRPGELTPGSRNLVVLKTLTDTSVLFGPMVARVKAPVGGAVVVAVIVRTVPVWNTSGTCTEEASTVSVPAFMPLTMTWSPTRTSLRLGELSPGSRNLVFAVTSTVTVEVCQPTGVMVKLAVTGMVEAVVVRAVEATGADRTVPVRVPP